MLKKFRAALAALAVTLGVVAPAIIAAPAHAAWTCSDNLCHAVSHYAGDDGYVNPIPVLCGANLIRYDIAVGQDSQGLGCNDVNRIGAKPGHATRCLVNGTWRTMAWQYPTESSIVWSSYNLTNVGAGTVYTCVDGKTNNGDTSGGQGGGGGGGGTW